MGPRRGTRRASPEPPSLRALLVIASLGAVPAAKAREYAQSYSFNADRSECDGQCAYCHHADKHHWWADIREKLTRYVYSLPKKEGSDVAVSALSHAEVQGLINYSWEKDEIYECIIGIISLRLLSYGFADPMQFIEGNDFDVLDFLDTFNKHTGTLDLLVSSWAAVLAGGWPVFREILHVSRKVRDRLADAGAYPQLQERRNECDLLDTPEDNTYREEVQRGLRTGKWPLTGIHLVALHRNMGCPVGKAVALLALALDMVRSRSMYQGSLKDPKNLVYSIISSAQDAVAQWVKTKLNWSPYFDLITTDWPLWELLSELTCVDTGRACATRSEWRCYDMLRRREVPCPHRQPTRARNFVSCGEHDTCTRPPALQPAEWCVPFGRRAPSPREPWLLQLGHDHELRVCAQCGQDGVLREIFSHIGFRDAAGSGDAGGKPPYFVEFGARKPGMLNSAALRELCHWDGLLMDSQPGETPHGGCRDCPGVAELVRREFVTAENIVDLLRKHGVPPDFDLLTVDTDFNDYWIWRALLLNGSFRPRVVAVDFNPDLPIDQALAVAYEAEGEWDGTVYTVASLLAYALLARAHGYVFAYALEMGAHAFFIRGDLVAEEDRDLPLRTTRKQSHPPDHKGRQFVDVLYDFVPGADRGGLEVVAAAGGGVCAASDASCMAAGGSMEAPQERARSVESHPSEELSALRQQVGDLVAELKELRAGLATSGGGAAQSRFGGDPGDPILPRRDRSPVLGGQPSASR